MDEQTQALIAQLHDIKLPDDPSWWPLALGWWIVILLSIVVVYWGLPKFQRLRIKKHKRNAALSELSHIETKLAQHSPGWGHQALTNLFKRLNISAFPNLEVASMTGRRWEEFIQEGALSSKRIDAGMIIDSHKAAYSAQPQVASHAVISAYRYWIYAHPPLPEFNANTPC